MDPGTLATLLYAFFENIDFNTDHVNDVVLCTNVTKDVLK
jgi:hypothetical protein